MAFKTVPVDYVHPRKKAGQADSGDRNQSDERASVKPTPPASRMKTPNTAKNRKAMPAASRSTKSSNQKVRSPILIPYPSDGVSEEFDQMIEANIDQKQALLGLLKKALPVFEVAIRKDPSLVTNSPYTHDNELVETTRMISNDTQELCRKYLDPFEILSDRAFGQKLGLAIMVFWFQRKK